MKALLTFIITAVILGAIFLYFVLTGSLIVYKFWYWFLLPVFPTMPHITFTLAIGLSFFIGLFKNHTGQTIKEEYRKDEWWENLLTPWIILLCGWLAHVIFF